jgi:NTE family protein
LRWLRLPHSRLGIVYASITLLSLLFVNKNFIAAQLKAQQRIAKNHYVLLRMSVGQQSDKVKEIFDHSTLIGGELAYYYNTIIGPLGGSVGYSNHTKKLHFFLNLGYEF